MTERWRWVWVALLVGVVLSACTDEPGKADAAPRVEPVDCPTDVEVMVVPPHSCGFVVRTARSGATMRVFFVRVEPPTPTDLAPIVETGTDLGMVPDYGGLAPVAQRTGRATVIIDLPGVGHSTPSLDCPEVDELRPSALGTPTVDVVGAIGACRARLERAGVDPGDATLPQLGEVLADVGTALGEPELVLMGHGTSAAAAIELANGHPGMVEAMVLDSFAYQAVPGSRVEDVIAGISSSCRADHRCRASHGAVDELWQHARERAERRPLEVAWQGFRITLDRAGLDRAVRWAAAGVDDAGQVPALLAEAGQGEVGEVLRRYAATVAETPNLCVGYLPKCRSGERLALGAVLAVLCPSTDGGTEWGPACEAWGAVAAGPSPVVPVDVPVLAVHGGLDPFIDPGGLRRDLAAMAPHAFVVELVHGGHNVLGDECVRTVRNAWLAGDPSQPPPRPDCLGRPVEFP